MNRSSSIDKALGKVADLIVERMEALKGENWKKPWFSTEYLGVPKNLSGRPYHGMNELILNFETTVKNRELPVFLTFNQAVSEGVRVKKGAVSTPILYYGAIYRDKEGEIVPESTVKAMSSEEKAELTKKPVLKKFDVFNIADTNFQEVHPERYEELKKQYAVTEIKDTQGMYSNKELDRMFEKQEWLCPIEVKSSPEAYYNRSTDSITLPLKAQFKTGEFSEEIYRNGMEFYSTALHEMTHSTGSSHRLDREKGKTFGDKAYAKEELVAELTSALTGQSLGFDRKVSDNSAKYLNNWVGALRQEPRFVLTVLGDVAKAHSLIMGEVEKQQIALQQTSQEQKGEKSRSLYDLPTQYSNINARYPSAATDEVTRQIAHRVQQAQTIIKTYEQNIANTYGKAWLDNPQNHHTPIPKSVYAMPSKAIIASVSDATLIKMRNGDYAIRAKVDGQDTGLIPFPKDKVGDYLKLSDTPQKESFLKQLVSELHSSQSRTPSLSKTKSLTP